MKDYFILLFKKKKSVTKKVSNMIKHYVWVTSSCTQVQDFLIFVLETPALKKN